MMKPPPNVGVLEVRTRTEGEWMVCRLYLGGKGYEICRMLAHLPCTEEFKALGIAAVRHLLLEHDPTVNIHVLDASER